MNVASYEDPLFFTERVTHFTFCKTFYFSLVLRIYSSVSE